MQHHEAADLLQLNLEEEQAADEALSALADGGINQSAAELAHPEMESEADDAAATRTRKRR
jgi:ferritin-like metal-binding protein YciE